MSLYHTDDEDGAADPMELVEAVLDSDDRFVGERAEDGDLNFTFRDAPPDIVGSFCYRDELPALMFTLGFELQAAPPVRGEAQRLAALFNENLWIGHFDVWSDDGSVVFRHVLPMIGRSEVSIGEIQALLASALDAAERFFPAFQAVLRDGVTAETAAQFAMFEVAGQA